MAAIISRVRTCLPGGTGRKRSNMLGKGVGTANANTLRRDQA